VSAARKLASEIGVIGLSEGGFKSRRVKSQCHKSSIYAKRAMKTTKKENFTALLEFKSS
jgi:hypothetical protein